MRLLRVSASSSTTRMCVGRFGIAATFGMGRVTSAGRVVVGRILDDGPAGNNSRGTGRDQSGVTANVDQVGLPDLADLGGRRQHREESATTTFTLSARCGPLRAHRTDSVVISRNALASDSRFFENRTLAGIIHGLLMEEAERRDVARSVSEGGCFINLCIQSALTHPPSLTLRATCVAVNNLG